MRDDHLIERVIAGDGLVALDLAQFHEAVRTPVGEDRQPQIARLDRQEIESLLEGLVEQLARA